MIFNKYVKTFEMYKDNKKRLENENIKQTDITKKSRMTATVNNISRKFKGPFNRKDIFSKKN